MVRSMIVGEIEYLDEDAELFSDGSVHDATLAHDTVICGVPCAGGKSTVFYPSGRLKLAWLSCPAVIEGIPCAAGVVLYLHEDGRALNATLAAEHRFGKLPLPPGTRVSLDEEGQLLEYSQRLDSDQLVAGLPCCALFEVWRYPSGQPSFVVLSDSCAIGGQEYPRGSEIAMEESGEVIRSHIADVDSGRRYKQRVFGVFEADWE